MPDTRPRPAHPLSPEQLRVAADAYDRKGSRLFDEGREDEANECWDLAINYRLEANAIEDDRLRKAGLIR